MSRAHRPEGVGAIPQKMGKVGRRRDMEQKGGSSTEAQADPSDPRNGASGEGGDDPTLQDVLQAITASRVALEGKIDALATDLTVLRDDHRRLAEKVSTTDRQLKELLPEKQRATFRDAKQNLRQLGLQYGMLFPAKLRVVSKDSTQFFTTAEEVWQWLDLLPHEGNGPPTQGPEHGRRRGTKRNTARIVNSPSPLEIRTERRKAMEAAASLSGSDRVSQVQTAADCEPSDSDHESETSHVSDRSGPGTSDCIT
ncbi:hypothetical protein NDU88_010896 [Pleurodeles waltl]|uniref:Uncharacterized protein n=1 Tax=Pleurodeles waltl TaxID=8319 RepID=A0AAV7R1K3_PLEWA|nr:hypothetical protein NDU88_010896 [Pleurodeles waltl]